MSSWTLSERAEMVMDHLAAIIGPYLPEGTTRRELRQILSQEEAWLVHVMLAAGAIPEQGL